MLSIWKKQKIPGIVKFLISSILGVFVFFIQLPVAGNSRIPVDHFIAFIKSLIQNYYGLIVFLLILFSFVLRVARKEKTSGMGIFYLLQSVFALLFLVAGATGILPEKFHIILKSALSATGNILCAIFITSIFVPLLVEYGLVDFVGVFVRPFMRKVFLTPGSSAIIGVSAFLGNYSMGHILSQKMYDEGEFTEKESVIVAVGFSTCSIGLMINLANYTKIMSHWNLYVLTILIATFITTIIVSRIPPISHKKDEYVTGKYMGAEKEISHTDLLKIAIEKGTQKASTAPSYALSLRNIMQRVVPVICEITGTSMFIIISALILLEYTNIFSWIGYIFIPVLWLCGFDIAEASVMAAPLGASLFEPVLAGVICEGEVLSSTAKWIVSVVPYTSIIFLAGFLPSLWKNKIHCNTWEALLIWVERMIISIIIAAIIARILTVTGMIE